MCRAKTSKQGEEEATFKKKEKRKGEGAIKTGIRLRLNGIIVVEPTNHA
jgi:hypothetical protein